MNHSPFRGTPIRSQRIGGESVSEDLYRAGSVLPRHLHEKAFFSLTLSGGYVEKHRRRAVDYVIDSIAFHPAGEEHSVSIGSSDVRCLNVELRDDMLDLVKPRFVRETGGRLVALGGRLLQELDAWAPWSALGAESLILEMVAVTGLVQSQAGDRVPPRWLASVDEIIRSEYATPMSMSRLAARAGVHPVHLARTWRRFRGCSLADTLRRLRIAEACRRIAARQALAEIALDLGFSDQAHFSRTFRRMTGAAPRAWRLSLSGG